MTTATIALAESAIKRSSFGRATGMPAIRRGMYPIVTAWRRSGENITNARTKHKSPLRIAVDGLTILGLGISVKSAPFIPALRETAPKAKISSRDSISKAKAMSSEGWAIRIPITPHTNVAIDEKVMTKAYLHLTKLCAVIGEEKKSHTDSPSSPIIIRPKNTAIMAPGPRRIQAKRNREATGGTGPPIPRYCIKGMRMKTMGVMKMYMSSRRLVKALKSFFITAASRAEKPSFPKRPTFGA